MIYQRCPALLWPTLISPGPLHNPERPGQCRKRLLLNRTGRAPDKHLYAQILLWEFIQDSNKAMSASSSPVIQRGAMPRKQDFPTTLINISSTGKQHKQQPFSYRDYYSPSPIPGRNNAINLACFLFPQKKTLASRLISNPCYTHEEGAS